MIEPVENSRVKLAPKVRNAQPMASASTMPRTPPSRHTSTASIRNCWRMSLWRAPTAMRTPISRVRSVTDTSMMFITPMPPTTSAMAAMAPISSVMVRVVDAMVSRISAVLLRKKSSVPWRRVNSRVMADCAASIGVSSLTRSVMLLR